LLRLLLLLLLLVMLSQLHSASLLRNLFGLKQLLTTC
jgi:hypothetical protein